MSNKQISGLPAASRDALDTDQIAIEDASNITKKLTALELKNYINVDNLILKGTIALASEFPTLSASAMKRSTIFSKNFTPQKRQTC